MLNQQLHHLCGMLRIAASCLMKRSPPGRILNVGARARLQQLLDLDNVALLGGEVERSLPELVLPLHGGHLLLGTACGRTTTTSLHIESRGENASSASAAPLWREVVVVLPQAVP